MSAATCFALALLEMEGVGRVTTGRLLHHFGTYEGLRQYPREQVLTRLKGVPHAAELVARLFDAAFMEPRLEAAALALRTHQERHVQILSPRDPTWPTGVNDLSPGQRPVLLYVYGHPDLLQQPVVALFARPPLSDAAFSLAQTLVQVLAEASVCCMTGAATGFDVVVHKLATEHQPPCPSALVAPCGLAKLWAPIRPLASRAVKAGGVMLSSFPMMHGPFEHDDVERALVMAALAETCVFVEPQPGSAEARALEWALEAGQPVFGIAADPALLPPDVLLLQTTADFAELLP
jgi:predicted Rossmann fold nucleotide-binding protein DprA/Smf involved in DNA uptake